MSVFTMVVVVNVWLITRLVWLLPGVFKNIYWRPVSSYRRSCLLTDSLGTKVRHRNILEYWNR